MAQMNNTVQVRLDGWIQGLPTGTSSWAKIFQVPHYLRKLNEEAYEPTIISIGPYHRQKDHLKAKEAHKVRFLKHLLRRKRENSTQRYVEVATGMMERARNCYSESLCICHEEFIEMMVLDGCFIVELIYRFCSGFTDDPIFNVSRIYNDILRDLILVENQLPFFVLWEFLGNAFEERFGCIHVIIRMFKVVMPGLTVRRAYDGSSIKKVKHLLDLLRTNWLPSEDPMCELENEREDITLIRFATELREAGIRFIRSEERNLFDIKFKNGTLYIPALSLEDHTGGLYYNIIACEQFDNHGSPNYMTDYMTVMDCLIDTGKDVELLCHKGIMHHWLGTGEKAAKIVNGLGKGIISKRNFFYTKLFNDVNRHYGTPCNKWRASLRHNYFNTPWALISFLAAAFLLLLTLLQTTFTMFPRS